MTASRRSYFTIRLSSKARQKISRTISAPICTGNLRKYSSAHITTLAQHAPDNLGFQSHATGMSSQFIKRAVSTKLGSSIHCDIRASIFAGYATKINSSQVRDEPPIQLESQLRYSFAYQKHAFSFNNLDKYFARFSAVPVPMLYI